MNCNTTHYRANSSSVPGDPTRGPSERPRAVVIALRTRTVPPGDAVEQACRALDRLHGVGAAPIYFKVCSTFDSTDAGNIGPVADALAERLGSRVTLVCPAFPTNGRTVYLGHLFVGDALLSESSMRHHPLTPMTDSNLVRVLARQSCHPVGRLPLTTVLAGPVATVDQLRSDVGRALAPPPVIRHLVADAVTDTDLETLGEAAVATGLPLCVGGSGLAGGLARALLGTDADGGGTSTAEVEADGPVVVLAGSCSEATQGQVNRFVGHRLVIDPRRLPAQLDELSNELLAGLERGQPVLVASTAAPADVAEVQRDLGREHASHLIDEAFGQLAGAAIRAGGRRLIVAGGETAGAVIDALGLRSLGIGPTISAGVPWTTARLPDGDEVALALKSGNFGGLDFFAEAVAVLDG